MKKVNIEELTRKLNEFRMSHQNKTFTRDELVEELHALGFNAQISGLLIPKLPYEVLGKSRLYSMPKDPIHKNLIGSFYTRCNSYGRKSKEKISEQNSEEAALALLAKKGYQIRKCVGFDLERFQKENPIIYNRYLKYEIV